MKLRFSVHQFGFQERSLRCTVQARSHMKGYENPTRTRAQYPLPKFFEVAKWLYTIILFKTSWGIYTMLCINNVW